MSPFTHLTPAGTSGKTSSRNQAIELLRIFSALGIVAFHAHAAGGEYGYAGLVAFVTISTAMDCKINWHKPRSLATLAQTLLLPWLFWLAIYAALNIIRHKAAFAEGPVLAQALYGTAGSGKHLWFLPFIFVSLSLLNILKRFAPAAAVYLPSLIGAAILLFSAGLWRDSSVAWQPPYTQWMQSIAAVLAGCAIGLAPRMERLGQFTLPLLGAAVVWLAFQHVPAISIPYALGLTAVVIADRLGERWPLPDTIIQPAAACMFGVYLLHPLMLSIASKFLGEASWPSVLAAFFISFAITWALRKFVPLSRRVLG
jgi:peptidoglycan/LPS O-acetylase OafA/YrhL